MAAPPEQIQLWQTVAPVEFVPKLASRTEQQSLLIAVRQGPGSAIIGGQLAHAIDSRATHILMDFSAQACSMRYQVDGSWENLPPLDRESGDAMLYALKQLCLMNPADRRGAQKGSMQVKVAKDKFQIVVQSQGVPTGERAMIRVEAEKMPFAKLADLGMRDKMVEQYRELLNTPGKTILISAFKGEGLTTLWTVSLNAADKFTSDFQSFEPAETPEPEVINVMPNLYGGDTGKTEVEVVNRMLLREPDVLVFPFPPQAESLQPSLEQVAIAERRLIHRFVAENAIKGLVAMLQRYPDSKSLLIKTLGGVLHQRLVRRLCDNCKVGFEPTPQLLSRLGIPQGRVPLLYQPFVPPPIEKQVDEQGRPAPIVPCHVCSGRGYYGRVGIFEFLIPGPQLREALGKTQDAAQLFSIAKSEGHRGMQSEAVLTVARGLTSLDELKRVFA